MPLEGKYTGQIAIGTAFLFLREGSSVAKPSSISEPRFWKEELRIVATWLLEAIEITGGFLPGLSLMLPPGALTAGTSSGSEG